MRLLHTHILTCGCEGGDASTRVALHLGTLCAQQNDEGVESPGSHNGMLVVSWRGGTKRGSNELKDCMASGDAQWVPPSSTWGRGFTVQHFHFQFKCIT